MHTKTIVNPKTGRQNRVRCWNIAPRQVYEQVKSGQIKDSRDLSWMLLCENESILLMEEEEYGDSAERNFALSTFENALDWRLGGKVLDFIYNMVRTRCALPKPFELVVNRKGDIFIIMPSGNIY